MKSRSCKIGKILVLLVMAILLYGCTSSTAPLHYKKLPHKFTQTADGHIIKQYTIDKPMPLYVVVLLKNGKIDGYRRYYEMKDGKINREQWFKNGIRQGKTTIYHKNGNIREIIPYKNGKREGVYSYFYDNGNLRVKKTYKNGHTGYGVDIYYINGKLSHIRDYKNGRREGRSREWFSKSDILESDTMYKVGSKHGTQKVYFEDGSLKYEVEYTYGKRVGKLKQYDKNGKLEYVVSYDSGRVERIMKHLPNGETLDIDIDSIFMSDRKGVVKYAK